MQDQPSLVTISPGATLQEAVARMIENDFSQLPVVEGGRPYGSPATFITSTSIARALRVFGTTLEHLRVRDALVPARTLSADEDLFSKMDDLLDAYAVLVLKPDGTIAGIVTSYDTTQYFRSRAEEMLLVEDVETTLKDHIRIACGGDETDPDGPLQAAIDTLGGPMHSVRDKCRKSFRKFCGKRGVAVTEEEVVEYIDAKFEAGAGERRFDDLTLNEYIQLALRSDAWAVLGPVFGIPSEAFRAMLEGVRKTRNKLMHFRPDITPAERSDLRFCAEWFKNHPPLLQADEPTREAGGATQLEEPAPAVGADADPTAYVEDAVVDEAGGSSDEAVLDEKYGRLGVYLSQIPRGQERIALGFRDVEEIIGAPLPATAREHRSWWANNAATHPHSEQWLKASWRVVSINMTLQRVVFARSRERERAYIHFFGEVQRRLVDVAGFPPLTVTPVGMSWLTLVYYRGTGCSLLLSFARGQRLRLECYIDTGDAAENEHIFASMLGRQEQIEAVVGAALSWEPLDGRRACRVALYAPGSIDDEPEDLERLTEWAVQYAPRLHAAIVQALPAGGAGDAA
jgi:CBS domain-containing protein